MWNFSFVLKSRRFQIEEKRTLYDESWKKMTQKWYQMRCGIFIFISTTMNGWHTHTKIEIKCFLHNLNRKYKKNHTKNDVRVTDNEMMMWAQNKNMEISTTQNFSQFSHEKNQLLLSRDITKTFHAKRWRKLLFSKS